jgi:CheY-like chemotaxis protein
MPNGGSLFVGAVNASINEESALPLNSGNHVKIVIRDTGTGIQPQILSKIFDPYFTTKTTGSGLGLATSYSIIKNHGGHIEVESTVGVGTEFRIYLPSAGESSGSRRQHHETIRKGSGRILLMDDEQYIRDLTRSMLELMGYQVACSSNGNDAIRQYKKAHSEGKRFDAVILDLTVQGGLGGKDTLEQLRAIDPDVRAIVCSGYSNDCVMARYFEYGFKGLVTKPFRVEDLSTTIDHVLSDKSQPAVSIS